MAAKTKKSTAKDAGVVGSAPPNTMGKPSNAWNWNLAALAPLMAGVPGFEPAVPFSGDDLEHAGDTNRLALSPDQQIDYTKLLGDLDSSDAGAVKSLKEAEASHDFSVSQAKDIFAHSSNETNGDAAARGVFQSSLRDSALDDLRKTRDTNINLLDTQLNSTRQEVGDPATGQGILGRNAQQRTAITGSRGQASGENMLAANNTARNAQPAPVAGRPALNAPTGFTSGAPGSPKVAPGWNLQVLKPLLGASASQPAPVTAATAYETVTKTDGKTYHHYPATPTSPERWVALRPK